VAGFCKPAGKFREVLDCGSPLPLSRRTPAVEKRQRAAAVQNLAEFSGGLAEPGHSFN